jgi:predicted O-methyltransferase YrrM
MDDMTFELTDGTEPEYEFTSDWFTRHKRLWDTLLDELKPKRILEIGSFEGRATTYLIEKCGQLHNTEIFCVDLWDDKILEHSDVQKESMSDVKKRFDKNIKLAQKNTQFDVTIYPFVADSFLGCSQIASQGIRDFDLVYVDGSHIASTVFFDAAMAFQLTRVGGVIIFDDYNEDKYMPWIYPKIAIDAFFKVHENKLKHVDFFDIGELIPLEKLYQRYFWKIRP